MLKKILYSLPLIALCIAGAAYYLINQEAKTQADLLVEQALASGSYEDVSYESVTVDLFTQELTLNNLRVVDLQHIEYILQQVIISDYDYAHETPYHLSMAIKGLSFPKGLPEMETSNSNAAFVSYMNSLLDADSIPVLINYSYNYAPENNNSIDSEMSIGLENAANLSFSSSFQNIPLESIIESNTKDPELAQKEIMTTLLAAEIPAASISMEDLGIIKVLMAIQAEEAGIPTEELRQELISSVQGLYLLAPVSTQKVAKQMSTELAKFLEGDKTFSLSIAPEFNGSIQKLQPQMLSAVFSGNYAAIVDLLNIEIDTQ